MREKNDVSLKFSVSERFCEDDTGSLEQAADHGYDAQKCPRPETYTKIRRSRVRLEGIRICAGLLLLHILPVLCWTVLLSTLPSGSAYVPDSVITITASGGRPYPISAFLVTQILQIDGVTLENATAEESASPPVYHSVTFRMQEENAAETAAAVRKIVSADSAADMLMVRIPMEEYLASAGKRETKNEANRIFAALLFLSACGASVCGTCMLLRQYLVNRTAEIQILSALGLSRQDCSRMLGRTVSLYMTVCGLVSAAAGTLVWFVYHSVSQWNENRADGVFVLPYRIAPEEMRLLTFSGISYTCILLVLGILILQFSLRLVYPSYGRQNGKKLPYKSQ